MATLDDVDYVARRIRKADDDECLAMSGNLASENIHEAFARSEICWVGLRDAEPVVIFGFLRYSMLSRAGAVWLLGTDEVQAIGVAILKRSRRFVKEMLSHVDRLENWVDARNTVAIRWLQWCGFTLEKSKLAGVANLPFHYFYIEHVRPH